MKQITRHLYSAVILLFVFTKLFSQTLSFEEKTFQSAIDNPDKSKSGIFVQIESPCETCNQVAYTGLSGEDIKELFTSFTCINIPFNSEDFDLIANRYRLVVKYPCSLWLNNKETY